MEEEIIALCEPKTIDLREYGSSIETSIGYLIMGFCVTGGGTQNVSNIGSFWADINTKKPLQIIFPFGEAYNIGVSGCTVVNTATGNGVVQLCFHVVCTDTTGTAFGADVMIIRQGDVNSAIVNVKVQELT